MPAIALSIVAYWKLKFSFEMLQLMLVKPDLGYDKWKIERNLFEFFLETKPIRETRKFRKGGLLKKPVMRPSEASFAKFAEATFGFLETVGAFFEI